MAEIQGQVENVITKQTATGKTVHLVKFSDGVTYATTKQPVANAAKASIGSNVVADVFSVQNGDYLNHYWNGCKTVVGGAGTSTPTVQTIPVAPPAQAGMPLEREQKIVKQSSFATAFNFVGQLYQGAGPEAHDEAVALARKLARALYDTVFGAEQLAAQPEPVKEEPPEESLPW